MTETPKLKRGKVYYKQSGGETKLAVFEPDSVPDFFGTGFEFEMSQANWDSLYALLINIGMTMCQNGDHWNYRSYNNGIKGGNR